MHQPVKYTNEKLMAAIPFTDFDLRSNQQFKLTESQTFRLKPEVDLYMFFSVCGMLISFVTTLIFLFSSPNATGLWLPKLLSFAVFGFCSFWMFLCLKWRNNLKKLRGVKFAEGKAAFTITTYQTSHLGTSEQTPRYWMTVGGVKIELDAATYHSIVGSQFRVYYFQLLTKKPLALENLD